MNVDMLRSVTGKCYYRIFSLTHKAHWSILGIHTLIGKYESLCPVTCKALGAYVIIVSIPAFISIRVETVLAVFWI